MDIPKIYISKKSLLENRIEIEETLDKESYLALSSQNNELIWFLTKLVKILKDDNSVNFPTFSFYAVRDIEFSTDFNNFTAWLNGWDIEYAINYE